MASEVGGGSGVLAGAGLWATLREAAAAAGISRTAAHYWFKESGGVRRAGDACRRRCGCRWAREEISCGLARGMTLTAIAAGRVTSAGGRPAAGNDAAAGRSIRVPAIGPAEVGGVRPVVADVAGAAEAVRLRHGRTRLADLDVVGCGPTAGGPRGVGRGPGNELSGASGSGHGFPSVEGLLRARKARTGAVSRPTARRRQAWKRPEQAVFGNYTQRQAR